jgi:hypothetical protein
MGVPTSEVSYTSATTGRGDHEVHKGHAVVLEKKHAFYTDSKLYSTKYYKVSATFKGKMFALLLQKI